MSRLFKVKEWLTLEATAARLSATFEENVCTNDVIQLALDGRLPLCCYLRHVYAQEVAFYTRIYNWFGGGEDDPSVPEIPLGNSKKKRRVQMLEVLDERVFFLDGVYRLAIDEFDKTRHWLLSQVLDEYEEGVSLEGIGYFDELNRMYRQVEFFEDANRASPTNRDHYPSDVLPKVGDLIIRRTDIEQFESSFNTFSAGEIAPKHLEVGLRTKWPWGAHHTELLGHLLAAGNHWWRTYDRADPSKAPTNEQVSSWLVERGLSRKMANSMATILRAEGLPSGPRQKNK